MYIRTTFLEIGSKFGGWTVLKDIGYVLSGNSKHKSLRYKCRCVCGKEQDIIAHNLTHGKSKSCNRCCRRLPTGEATKNVFFYRYKYHAKRRKINWSLTKKQFNFLVSQCCNYCGSLPRPMVGKRYHGQFSCDLNGVDRKDSNKGYFLENCVPCCSDCNRIKSDKSEIEFLSLIEKIYNYSKKGEL